MVNVALGLTERQQLLIRSSFLRLQSQHGIGDWPALAAYLEQLGAGREKDDAQSDDYATAGTALIATLGILLGQEFSSEMEEAWTAIKNDPRVFLTIDLFFIGLVFLREEFKVKQDFVIRY